MADDNRWRLPQSKEQQYTFSQDLHCFLCKRLARDPHQTNCECIKLYCKTCLKSQRDKSDKCPTCKNELIAFPDRLSGHRINALLINNNNATEPENQKCDVYKYTMKSTFNNIGNGKVKLLENNKQDNKEEDLHGDRNDVIMLYLPFFIVCTMIVCIVSSAIVLGHV